MAATEEILHVFLNETAVGRLTRGEHGRLRFRYEKTYLTKGPGTPISLSMPLDDAEHAHDKIDPFLWGLLPDSDEFLRRWSAHFHVGRSNAFGLLAEIGEDCAGAIRFIREDRLKSVTDGGKDSLGPAKIEKRLSDLKRDASLSREFGDRGQFSLAGAQAKTALQKIGSRWFLPWGTEPTTHIIKPPRPDLAGHVENEHFCLQLASRLGLRAATSEVAQFGKETAIVVERYDRLEKDGKIIRIHQEDMCQALSIHPAQKYENQGGPGIRAIMDLLNQSSRSTEDRERFMAAVVFNYVLLGPDAHAKNYSLLLGDQGTIRLAPLYDIASILPYVPRPRDLKFAMRVDGHYRDGQILPRHFDRLARQCEFPTAKLRDLIGDYVSRIPPLSKEIYAEMVTNKIDHPKVTELVELIGERCTALASRFEFPG